MGNIRYSIKDLENFTQIKAHTIRIWEKRYGLLEPKRTNSNIRYYNENDLKKILNISLLYTSGFKISKIASLTESQIVEEAKSRILVTELDKQSEIDALTLLILNFKADQIHKILERELKKQSLDQLYMSLILPLLSKIGQLWQVNSINIVHEHYFSIIFRNFLISKTSQIDTMPDPLKTAMLFLHDNEEHEFSLLIYQYILKKQGYTCHYFGQKVPIKEIEPAFAQIKPQIVVSTFTTKVSDKSFLKIEKVLKKMSKDAQVIVSGSQLANFDLKPSKKLLQIKTIAQLKTLLK
ncbi:MAG: DNA-binding transcriptional MerR regulator [Crocinitomicaceae bacterium]